MSRLPGSSLVAAVCMALAVSAPVAQDRPRLALDAERQVGRVATLCGTVVRYQCRRPDRTSLMALDEPFSKGGVSVAVAPANRGPFGALLEQRHVLQEVCATGMIQSVNGGYVIWVTKPDDLHTQGAQSVAVPYRIGTLSSCDDEVELPEVIREVKPQYTADARKAGIEGAVWLEAVVETNGRVGKVRQLQSLDKDLGLDEQAVKALRSWQFVPGTRRGTPAPVVVTIEMSFSLRD